MGKNQGGVGTGGEGEDKAYILFELAERWLIQLGLHAEQQIQDTENDEEVEGREWKGMQSEAA